MIAAPISWSQPLNDLRYIRGTKLAVHVDEALSESAVSPQMRVNMMYWSLLRRPYRFKYSVSQSVLTSAEGSETGLVLRQDRKMSAVLNTRSCHTIKTYIHCALYLVRW